MGGLNSIRSNPIRHSLRLPSMLRRVLLAGLVLGATEKSIGADNHSFRLLALDGAEDEHMYGPEELLWVHTPKTGSSFCMTLQHDQCMDKWPSEDHWSMKDLILSHGCAKPYPTFSCRINTGGHSTHVRARTRTSARVTHTLACGLTQHARKQA